MSRMGGTLPFVAGELDGEEYGERFGTAVSTCLGCGCSPCYLVHLRWYTMGYFSLCSSFFLSLAGHGIVSTTTTSSSSTSP